MFSFKLIFSLHLFLCFILCLSSCTKTSADLPNPSGTYQLSYGDSILYLRNQATDYVVFPTETRAGRYSAFPDGIQVDEKTGAINLSKSETGLRYRITYFSAAGDSSSTVIVLSGITFRDHFYYLSKGDSISKPIYNASESRTLPLAGSNFDEGNNANSGGCSVKTNNGTINLAETVRNGVFGSIPANNERRDFDIAYRINDQSGKSLNNLRVRLYYYATLSDVAPDLLQTLQDRQLEGVFIGGRPGSASTTENIAKPRPPCVIIIAN